MTPSARRSIAAVAAALMISAGIAGTTIHAAAATTTQSFTAAGCSSWVDPAGVSTLQIAAVGAAGATGTWPGGRGDGANATLSGLAAGQTLTICVGTGGGAPGYRAGQGGGASGVSRGSNFSAPLLVAGGGGGGGSLYSGNFASGGGAAGLPNGQAASPAGGYAGGGGGGTQSAGGYGGYGPPGGAPGASGSGSSAAGPGSGGRGGSANLTGGGGGGAGYFGGGGGSDFCTNTTTVSGCAVTPGAGTQTGSGPGAGQAKVTLTYTTPQAPAITSPATTTLTAGTAGSFTVTATGTPAPALSDGGASLPAGVTFTDNGNGTATLAGTPAAGSGGRYPFTITASNGVSPNATQNFSLTIDQAPAITSANSTSFTVGVPGTFTVQTTGYPGGASMTVTESGALPAGVTFVDNGSTATLAGVPAPGSAGTYPLTITASNGVAPNATQSFTLKVVSAGTTTTLSSSANPSVTGQSVTFTATVSSTSGGSPGGTVQFTDGGTTITGCTARPVSAGQAICTTALMTATGHTIGASYNGDSTFGGSTAPALSQQVNRAATTTSAASSPDPSTAGQNVTTRVTVKAVAPGGGNPDGSVTIFIDGTPIATVALDTSVDSLATFTTGGLTVGTHTITATYSGSANYAGSATTPGSQAAQTVVAGVAGAAPAVSVPSTGAAPMVPWWSAFLLLLLGVLLIETGRRLESRPTER